MAPKVVLMQVSMKLVIVQVALITKLAQWVTFVRGVILITLSAMLDKVFTRVRFKLAGKQFKIVCAYITIEQVVSLTHVVTQQLESAKRWFGTFSALVFH